jgi:hypothetical protein
MKFGIPHNIDVESVVTGVEVLFLVVVANNAQAWGENVIGGACVCVCLRGSVAGWQGTSPPITKASHVRAVCKFIILQASQSPTSKVYSCI